MTIKELKEKRSALLAEIEGADEKRFAEIKHEISKLDYQISALSGDEEARAAEEAREAELRAAREPNEKRGSADRDTVVLFDQKVKTAEQRKTENTEELEKRSKKLKDGESVMLEKRAVGSSQTALATVTSGEITPAFEQAGTLDQLVNNVHLEGAGAESYKKPFVKSIGEGEIVEEGKAPAGGAEPTFDYAEINKVKIVAYAEVNEEVEKLPAAAYMAEIDQAVVNAWRKKVISQILSGSGNGELVGIINAPEKIIEASQRKTIAAIDEHTLDEIIFHYGGDEDVEGDAYLILNKLTLKEFAKVKGTDKRRAYDIVVKGNTGTINGVPFVCTGRVSAFGAVAAGDPYIIYGKPQGYELAHFTDLEVSKSKDYKFKEGVTAYKVVGFVGGSPAMWNGFMTVEKEAKA